MAEGIDLVRVQKGKGRVHLTVAAPAKGAARTLCNQVLEAGSYNRVDGEANCQSCLRRKDNRALVSSSFFNQDAGTALLELAVAQSRQQKRERASQASTPATPRGTARAKPKPVAAVEPPKPPPPTHLGPLQLAGFERVSEMVYRSKEGVAVRLGNDDGRWTVNEVAYEGPTRVRVNDSGTVSVMLGDVRVELGPGSKIRAVTTGRRAD